MNHSKQFGSINNLGTQPVLKLLLTYAVPSVVTMLVMSLYGIIDQIFINWYMGHMGNTAMSIVHPLNTIALAITLLIGNGCVSFISLELGKKEFVKSKVQKAVGNAIAMLTIVSMLMSIIVLIFIRPILLSFGATEESLPYALEYTTIMMLGIPFAMIGRSVSTIIRSDGSPKYSMFSSLIGIVLSIILTPIFIFTFEMGIRGAAISTVISQAISCFFALLYICKYAKVIRFSFNNIKLDYKICSKILVFGSSSFLTQLVITLLSIVLNNSLRIYGENSIYGAEIPLAAIGIVTKTNTILTSVILGIALGTQPILGYNYSAKNYKRVKLTYKIVLVLTTSLAFLCNLIFVFAPEIIISIFGSDSEDFFEFACKYMQIYLLFSFVAGIHIPTSSYFQATGRPRKAMIITILRNIVISIPLIIILPHFFGLYGILYAGAMTDILMLCLTGIFILKEMKSLNKKK